MINCYVKSVTYFKRIKIMKIYYFGNILFIYKKGDNPINVSRKLLTCKQEIKLYLKRQDKMLVEKIKKGLYIKR